MPSQSAAMPAPEPKKKRQCRRCDRPSGSTPLCSAAIKHIETVSASSPTMNGHPHCFYCEQPAGSNSKCPICGAHRIQFEPSLYRIVTERKNVLAIERIVTHFFDGLFISWGRGLYKRNGERALTIDIVTNEAQKVFEAAKIIKLYNEQEEVLVLRLPITSWRI